MLATQYLGMRYEWASNGPFSYDCSAFVQKVLREADIIKDNKDRTAQGIYNLLSKSYFQFTEPNKDCVLFFGKSLKKITHVALAVNETYLIHAGGGGRRTLTIEDAVRDNAYVKYQKINYRSDLIACLYVGDGND